MTVNARNPGEDMTTTPPQRIGGWLLGPLAWLLVALLSASLALLLYVMALATPQTFKTLSGQETGNLLLWGISFITAIAMWYYRRSHSSSADAACRSITLSGCWCRCYWRLKHLPFRPSQMPLPCVSYSSHCWRRRSLCLISNVQRALKQRLLIRNNPTVNLLSPVVV